MIYRLDKNSYYNTLYELWECYRYFPDPHETELATHREHGPAINYDPRLVQNNCNRWFLDDHEMFSIKQKV